MTAATLLLLLLAAASTTSSLELLTHPAAELTVSCYKWEEPSSNPRVSSLQLREILQEERKKYPLLWAKNDTFLLEVNCQRINAENNATIDYTETILVKMDKRPSQDLLNKVFPMAKDNVNSCEFRGLIMTSPAAMAELEITKLEDVLAQLSQ
jgi:hypothetical protein